jgi:hypothetical protein
MVEGTDVDYCLFLYTPEELRRRVVRIFQPTRNTMQSGPAKGERWRIDWDVMPGGGRWENSLIGWASSCVPTYCYFFKRALAKY